MSKQIVLPFRAIFRDALLNGVKTCTSRTRIYGVLGDVFGAFGGMFENVDVVEMPLLEVANCLYLSEGVASPEAFMQVWCDIHPIKGFVPMQNVYVHFFRRIYGDRWC